MVRHGVPVVGVMGNNGIWALEKHPMEFLYGYSVAADLQPGLPLRPGGRGPGRPRRARRAPRRAAAGARAGVRVGQAGARERAHRSGGRLPPQVQPRLGRSKNGTARIIAGGSKTAPSGRAGVRALKGPRGPDGGRRRYDAASPEPMYREGKADGLSRTAFSTQRGVTIEDHLALGKGCGRKSTGLRSLYVERLERLAGSA